MPRTEEGLSTHDSKSKSKYFLVAFKVLEMSLVIIAIGLIDDPTTHSNVRTFVGTRTIALAYASFGTFLIFSVIYMLSMFLGEPFSWKISSLMSFVAFVLFIACACTILNDWSTSKERGYWTPNIQRLDLICGTGFLCVILAVVFLLDFGVTIYFGISGNLT